MHYEIMSRTDASAASREADSPDTVIISITDTGDDKNTFYSRDWIKGILELQFNDVEAGSSNCITVKQAEKIADFVLLNRKKVKRIIVHCEFGQSRSAGVAAAIRSYFDGNDGGIFRSRRYAPNTTCYHYVLNALRKRGRISSFLRKE